MLLMKKSCLHNYAVHCLSTIKNVDYMDTKHLTSAPVVGMLSQQLLIKFALIGPVMRSVSESPSFLQIRLGSTALQKKAVSAYL